MAKNPGKLLAAVADALNACERAGIKVRLRHGAVITHWGVVVPPERKGQAWEARAFSALPQSPAESEAGDDD